MKRIITMMLLCAGIAFNASAQTFTQRLQQKQTGQGTVTINQDPEIDQLVNSEVLGKVSTGNNTAKHPNSTNSTNNSTNNNPNNSVNKTANNTAKSPNVQNLSSEENDNPQDDGLDTSKKMIRGGHKVTGYRVQAFAGGNSRKDRIQAEQIGNNIKAQFANVPVYVHFYSPRWICRVGNYRTYEEAHQMLVHLRNLGYNQASIVKGKITVHY